MSTRLFMIICLVGASTLASGCAAPSAVVRSSDTVTVEGMINVWGAEPFTGIVLYTDNRNTYVLKLSVEDRERLVTPVSARVTGRVYIDTWRGQPFAHLDVTSIDLPDQ